MLEGELLPQDLPKRDTLLESELLKKDMPKRDALLEGKLQKKDLPKRDALIAGELPQEELAAKDALLESEFKQKDLPTREVLLEGRLHKKDLPKKDALHEGELHKIDLLPRDALLEGELQKKDLPKRVEDELVAIQGYLVHTIGGMTKKNKKRHKEVQSRLIQFRNQIIVELGEDLDVVVAYIHERVLDPACECPSVDYMSELLSRVFNCGSTGESATLKV